MKLIILSCANKTKKIKRKAKIRYVDDTVLVEVLIESKINSQRLVLILIFFVNILLQLFLITFKNKYFFSVKVSFLQKSETLSYRSKKSASLKS